MITIDEILLNIVNQTNPTIEDLMPARDSRVLRSLATSVNSHYFITENQSNLILKLFKEHKNSLVKVVDNLSELIVDPIWSKSFRQIEEYKKLQLSKNEDSEPILSIYFYLLGILITTNYKKVKMLSFQFKNHTIQ